MNDNKFNDNELNQNELNSNAPQMKKKTYFEEVPIYSDILSINRRNVKVEGYDFDVDMFENMIDNFVPYNNIPLLLSASCKKKLCIADLDRFCKIVYGMDYKDTYEILSGITDMQMRKVFKNLAASGNATAIAINAKHFMHLEDENKNDAINIRILNDLNDK